MFSTLENLKKKTPCKSPDRRSFIERLVNEYHTTTNVEAQEQVSANLANFAYDPINWQYLKQSGALELFMELLQTRNVNLQLHGYAGLCNICLDKDSADFITNSINVPILVKLLLNTTHPEIFINCLTLFYQLLYIDKKKSTLVDSKLLKHICSWRDEAADQRILNLCNVFLEDYSDKRELAQLSAQ